MWRLRPTGRKGNKGKGGNKGGKMGMGARKEEKVKESGGDGVVSGNLLFTGDRVVVVQESGEVSYAEEPTEKTKKGAKLSRGKMNRIGGKKVKKPKQDLFDIIAEHQHGPFAREADYEHFEEQPEEGGCIPVDEAMVESVKHSIGKKEGSIKIINTENSNSHQGVHVVGENTQSQFDEPVIYEVQTGFCEDVLDIVDNEGGNTGSKKDSSVQEEEEDIDDEDDDFDPEMEQDEDFKIFMREQNFITGKCMIDSMFSTKHLRSSNNITSFSTSTKISFLPQPELANKTQYGKSPSKKKQNRSNNDVEIIEEVGSLGKRSLVETKNQMYSGSIILEDIKNSTRNGGALLISEVLHNISDTNHPSHKAISPIRVLSTSNKSSQDSNDEPKVYVTRSKSKNASNNSSMLEDKHVGGTKPPKSSGGKQPRHGDHSPPLLCSTSSHMKSLSTFSREIKIVRSGGKRIVEEVIGMQASGSIFVQESYEEL